MLKLVEVIAKGRAPRGAQGGNLPQGSGGKGLIKQDKNFIHSPASLVLCSLSRGFPNLSTALAVWSV